MKKIFVIVGILVVLMLFMAPASQAAPPAWGGDCGSGGTHHCVRYGETLFSIGRKYGVNPYHIAHVNGLRDPNYIYAGQILYIPSGHPYPEQPIYHPDKCGHHPCGSRYHQGYGYDYTGYYYDAYYPKYKRYSYTCGYYHNCY